MFSLLEQSTRHFCIFCIFLSYHRSESVCFLVVFFIWNHDTIPTLSRRRVNLAGINFAEEHNRQLREMNFLIEQGDNSACILVYLMTITIPTSKFLWVNLKFKKYPWTWNIGKIHVIVVSSKQQESEIYHCVHVTFSTHAIDTVRTCVHYILH